MSAAEVAPQAGGISWRMLAAAVAAWMKGHIVSVVTAAVVGTVIGFIFNVWLLAFVYEGYEKVPPGGPAPGLNNEVVGTLFWLLISTVVFGTYGYYRAVGSARFFASLRERPAMVRSLFSGGGNAALAALLWGAMLSLLVTVVVGPAIGAVLGVGIFATAFGFIGRLITVAAMRGATAVLKVVQPSRTAAPSPAAITAGVVGGSLAMVVGFALPNDPYSGPVGLRLFLAIGCGILAFVLSRPTAPAGPVAVILIGLGGLVLYDLLHPLVVFALDGGSLECGGLGVADYVLQPCPGKETVTVLSGAGGVAAGFGAGPGLAAGNLLGTNPNWGPGIQDDTRRGGVPGEETPGKPGDEDYTETITDEQGNVVRTVTHRTDPVTGDVTVTTTNSQGQVTNTIKTHVDPISGDTTISRTNAQGQPVVAETTHVDPITGDTTTTITNAQGTPVRTTTHHTDPITGDTTTSVANVQGTPIRTSTTHVDPITGDVKTTVTNSQGNPTRTFTTHTDPVSGDVTRTVLNPQNQPIRTSIDHVDPITGDTTRTTLNPQGSPITTQNWHTDPVTGDTTHTILNPQGSPIRTEIDHTDPITGDTTKTILNPQGRPIGTEIHHTDPVTGDTTRTIFNPQGSPIETELVHKDPVTGDTTRTILNEQGQPTRTEVWHEDPNTGDEVHSSYNPQGQPISTEIYHTDPISGDTSVTVLNEQGRVESTYTVHKDPITGLWVPDPAPPAGSALADGAAAVGAGLGGVNVGSGLAGGGQVAGPGSSGPAVVPPAPGGPGTGPGSGDPAVVPAAPEAQTDQATGPGSGGPAVVPPEPDDFEASDGIREGITHITGEDEGLKGTFSDDAVDKPAPDPSSQPSAPAPADEPKSGAQEPSAPASNVLDDLTSLGPTTVPADKAFETLHEVIPDVGSDGTVGPLTLKEPKFENGGVTVQTALGPATAKLGVDDQGHLTATITDMPKDPFNTGLMPTQDEATQGMKTALDDFNRQLDAKGVKLTDVRTEGGQLILTKGPISGPPPNP